jgi:hypothetical protein
MLLHGLVNHAPIETIILPDLRIEPIYNDVDSAIITRKVLL